MFDLIIKNGTIVNGQRRPFRADVGLRAGRIAALGSLPAQATTVLDAAGCCVTPGFIDMHGHGDFVFTHRKPSLEKISQGVTTEVIGNCGISGAPYSPASYDFIREYFPIVGRKGACPHWYTWPRYLKVLRASPLTTNVVPLVGHGNLRTLVMGSANRPARPAEMRRMCRVLSTLMEQGCPGFSSGLIYSPGIFTPPEELLLLAETAARYGGLYTSHIRGEGITVEEAVTECLTVAEKTGLSTEISHMKTAGPDNWSKTAGLIRRLTRKREQGVDINFDQYPYTASSTTAVVLLPPWMREGGISATIRRLKDPADCRRAAADIRKGLPGWENYARSVGWRKIIINQVGSTDNRWMEGLDLEAIARRLGQDPITVLIQTFRKENGAVNMITHTMSEDSVQAFLKQDFGFIGTDGLSGRRPHPRLMGSFGRVLRRYVHETKLLTLTQAVHKMSSGPARKLGLSDRGEIARGKVADVTIFDPMTVRDNATYRDPNLPASGFKAVIVNGKIVMLDGRYTGATAGQVLLR